MLRRSALATRGDGEVAHSLFNILNTPLAIAIQRSSAVTSVVMKIRLRVVRTTCGRDDQGLADLAGLDEMGVELDGRQMGLPETKRAVMPQVRSAKVMITPP